MDRVFWEKLRIAQIVKKFSIFIKIEGLVKVR
jgi:hypothetical protein